MTMLQHQRITALAQELRLHALPDLYSAVAQSAAKRKDASYADFLEEVLKGERDVRRVRAREMLTRIAGFPALKTLDQIAGESYRLKDKRHAGIMARPQSTSTAKKTD